MVEDLGVDQADTYAGKSRIQQRDNDRQGIDNSPDQAETGHLNWRFSLFLC